MATLLEFFESLGGLSLVPILTALFISTVCAVIGTFIILRGMVFLVDGIAHAAFAGGALSILLGLNPFLTIGIFSVTTGIGMAYINDKGKLDNDVAIGILFAFAMALGVIFIGLITSYQIGVEGLLFGSIIFISNTEFLILVIMGSVALLVTFIIRKELFFITFDEDLARANGMPVRKLSYLFLIMVSVVVVVCVKTIGVILLLAFIVTPAATAYQFTFKLNKMILYAIIIAMVSSFLGYMIAYILEITASGAIVVLLTITFIGSLILSPKRRFKQPPLDEGNCEFCKKAVDSAETCEYCEIHSVEGHDHNHEMEHELDQHSDSNHTFTSIHGDKNSN